MSKLHDYTPISGPTQPRVEYTMFPRLVSLDDIDGGIYTLGLASWGDRAVKAAQGLEGLAQALGVDGLAWVPRGPLHRRPDWSHRASGPVQWCAVHAWHLGGGLYAVEAEAAWPPDLPGDLGKAAVRRQIGRCAVVSARAVRREAARAFEAAMGLLDARAINRATARHALRRALYRLPDWEGGPDTVACPKCGADAAQTSDPVQGFCTWCEVDQAQEQARSGGYVPDPVTFAK